MSKLNQNLMTTFELDVNFNMALRGVLHEHYYMHKGPPIKAFTKSSRASYVHQELYPMELIRF